ncbi:MAG: peptidoglycan-binding domain-containing protein [Pseudomonadota bacterium]
MTSDALGTQPSTDYLSAEQIIAIQEALEANGYDVGRIDGIMGKKTNDAILEFQTANSLKETGVLNLDTARALGLMN